MSLPLIRSNAPGAFSTTVIPLHELGAVARGREPGVLGETVEELHHAADRYAKALRALGSVHAGTA